MATAASVTKMAIAPVNLLAAPSSCSMNSSALCKASSVTAPASDMETRWGSFMGPAMRSSIHLHAFFGEVLERARMERDRRGRALLVLELDVLGFLVHGNQFGLLLED